MTLDTLDTFFLIVSLMLILIGVGLFVIFV
jgi:hypothetical protein